MASNSNSTKPWPLARKTQVPASKRLTCFAICLLMLVGATGCWSSSNEKPSPKSLKKVKLQLNWVPEAEHGGFYAAVEHGYYKKEGLEVEIVPGGVGAPVLQQVVMGRCEFGVANADIVLLGRNDDAKVKAIMAPIQYSPRCILVRPEMKIKSLTDLKNLTLSANPANPFLVFLQKKLPLEGVKVVPHQSMQGFFTNKNYAQQGYSFSEPFLAMKQKIQPDVLMVSDLGFNPYTSCLIASDSMIQDDPETVKKFVSASIKGWEHYLREPEQTNKKIASLNPDQDSKSLTFAIDDIRKLSGWNNQTQTAQPPIGQMTDTRMNELAKQLAEIGMIKKPETIAKDSYSLDFLKDESGNESDGK